ncbi:PadR family transcriptional regulator [Methanobacterium sp.]|uniref:PadR family transcriptional regulator n=1 Tax=Methanobacterium sp. TaxID=2164 RepID=UPI003C70639A
MSLSHAILGLLTYRPLTGYGLKKIFDKSISHVWAASLSQIYRELSALEKKGYVHSNIKKQEGRPDKKIYNITEEGKNSFHDWLKDFSGTFSSPKRDEFMLKIFFGSKLEKEQLIMEFNQFISQKREYLISLKEIEKNFGKYRHEFTVNIPEEEEIFWNFTIKRGIMNLEVAIKWAEECIEELEKM